MDSDLILIAVGLIVVIAVVVQLKGSRTFPYVKAGPLLTAPERVLYAALARATDASDVVMVKVRVADLIKIKDGVSQKGQSSAWWKAFAQISQKHVDYVILDRASFEPKLVVELDDASHRQAKAKENDDIKNKAFGAAGLPILRVKPQRNYDVNALASMMIAALQPPPKVDGEKTRSAA